MKLKLQIFVLAKSTRTCYLVQTIPVQTLPVVVAHFLNNPRPITLTYLTFVIEISQTPPLSSTAPLGALSAYTMRQVYSQFPVVVQPTPCYSFSSSSARGV